MHHALGRTSRATAALAALTLWIATALAAVAAEPALHCQFTNPNTHTPLSVAFHDNPMIITTPGSNITLTATAHGTPGEITVYKGSQPIRTGGVINLTAPQSAGSYYIPLSLSASGQTRQTEICVLVPHKGTARRVQGGFDVNVDEDNVGSYREPSRSGNRKVKGHPEVYMPPPLWLRVTDMNAAFSVVPGLRAADLVVASEDTGKKHTDLVPVCYPMWLTIHTLREELTRRGIPGHTLTLISMFRSPPYNRSVGSNAYGRHVYGDAFDFYIDPDGKGKAADLNRDGKRDRRDAYPVVAAIEDLQADGRIPMGGIGVYNNVSGDHEVTMHLDMRGHRATWGYFTGRSGKKSEFCWASRRFADLDRREEDEAAARAAAEGRRYSRPNREALP